MAWCQIDFLECSDVQLRTKASADIDGLYFAFGNYTTKSLFIKNSAFSFRQRLVKDSVSKSSHEFLNENSGQTLSIQHHT